MGVAAAGSWWIASRLAPQAASYAPITAIVALGLGRERRLGRSAVLTSGLFLGVVAAEIATALIGVGAWQIGAAMALTAVVAGAVVGRDLAVTYAAINAVVLLTTPGGDGWFPGRFASGLIGVGTALTVLLVVAPARPAHLVQRRLGRAADRAAGVLTATADTLASRSDGGGRVGDARPLVVRARRLDDEIEQSHGTVDQARELVRWSPWRRRDRADVERLERIANELRPALRTASTIARLADRADLLGLSAPAPMRDAIRRGAATLSTLTYDLLAASPPGTADVRGASDVVRRLLATEIEHAVLVALKEELRGLLADLDDIVELAFDDVPEAHGLDRATVGDVTYGRS